MHFSSRSQPEAFQIVESFFEISVCTSSARPKNNLSIFATQEKSASHNAKNAKVSYHCSSGTDITTVTQKVYPSQKIGSSPVWWDWSKCFKMLLRSSAIYFPVLPAYDMHSWKQNFPSVWIFTAFSKGWLFIMGDRAGSKSIAWQPFSIVAIPSMNFIILPQQLSDAFSSD